ARKDIGAVDNTSISDLIWRVYESGSASNKWGVTYDFDGEGVHSYLIGAYLPGGNSFLMTQNITLDVSNIKADDIKKVTLGITYRYLDGSYPNDNAYLLFGFWDKNANQYNFDLNGSEQAFSIGGNVRKGFPLPVTKDGTWGHFTTDSIPTLDLTNLIKQRIRDYEANGTKESLKFEVGFSAWTTSSLLNVYFDDIVLNIEYYDYPSSNGLNTTGMLNLEDLFRYLQEKDPETGNMFNIFYELSKDSNIDGVTFFKYLGNDGDLKPNGNGEVDFFKYLQYTNTSIALLADLLKNKYQDLGVGEPINFFDMFRRTKYKPIPAGTPNVKNNPNYVLTPYGPRFKNDEFWVIEDPLKASLAIVKNLEKSIFEDTFLGNQFREQELWYMFDNLNITIPWIILYLLSHGWSKDDVFDAFEALGFAKEVKDDFPDNIDGGELKTRLHIWGSGLLGFFDFDDYINFTFDMDPVLDDGVQELYSTIVDSGRKYLVNNYGDIEQSPYHKRITGTLLGFISFTIDLWVKPESFWIKIWVEPDGSKLVAPPTDVKYKDYLVGGGGAGEGLNDAGAVQIMHNMRCQFQYNGNPFIFVGGDPISLFTFLDTYYFQGFKGIDYSSYQLFHYFNMSAIDFIELITGYDREKGIFDPNGNGKADDWRAPEYYYGGGNPTSLNGWGSDFWHARLFWNETEYPDSGQENGAVIWSDNPDFAKTEDQFSIHTKGKIVVGNKLFGDIINKSAPPIVDLFDMLAWICDMNKEIKQDKVIEWLIGALDDSYYQLVDPIGNAIVDPNNYNKMTNQEIWNMFTECSFNATGFFDWLKNDKSVDVFKFLYVLNQSTPTVNPLDLLFFATNPNLVRFFDGEISLMYHSALDSQSTIANDLLWKFFNYSSVFSAEGFFKFLDENNFNIFQMFLDLKIDPASWLNLLNKMGLEPIEVIKRMKIYKPGYYYLEFKSGTSVTFDIRGNMTLTYKGIQLQEFKNMKIGEDKVLTADYHFSEFIRSERLTGNNFVIF
ncbi:MAG: hypothetical protein ACP6IY_07820, partial [Promethearchaeia archaeon]